MKAVKIIIVLAIWGLASAAFSFTLAAFIRAGGCGNWELGRDAVLRHQAGVPRELDSWNPFVPEQVANSDESQFEKLITISGSGFGYVGIENHSDWPTPICLSQQSR